jgi:hypothetical protein
MKLIGGGRVAASQTACLEFKLNSSNSYEIRGRPGEIRDGNRATGARSLATQSRNSRKYYIINPKRLVLASNDDGLQRACPFIEDETIESKILPRGFDDLLACAP